jgi:hypothetical protein
MRANSHERQRAADDFQEVNHTDFNAKAQRTAKVAKTLLAGCASFAVLAVLCVLCVEGGERGMKLAGKVGELCF